MSLLTDPRLNRDYPSKVLQALIHSEDPHYLVRTYIRTAKPLLTEPDDIDAYTIALAESSLMEAWLYQRSFSEASDTRKRLIDKILDWCLTRKPSLFLRSCSNSMLRTQRNHDSRHSQICWRSPSRSTSSLSCMHMRLIRRPPCRLPRYPSSRT